MPQSERLRVWNGTLKKTSGGLTKNDLMKNKRGKIVSKKKSAAAKQSANNLGAWLRSKGDHFLSKGVTKENIIRKGKPGRKPFKPQKQPEEEAPKPKAQPKAQPKPKPKPKPKPQPKPKPKSVPKITKEAPSKPGDKPKNKTNIDVGNILPSKPTVQKTGQLSLEQIKKKWTNYARMFKKKGWTEEKANKMLKKRFKIDNPGVVWKNL